MAPESSQEQHGSELDGVRDDLLPRRLALALWIAIFLGAGLMRLAGLDRCPAGFFRDEAEKGYNAYALATAQGAVEFSDRGDGLARIGWNRWPYLIDVMGVKTSAIYQYCAAPFVRVMGLEVGATRMPAAVAGTLTVGLLGLLFLRIWPPGFALGAMAWLALCPWHYLFSRWALQGIFVPLGMIAALAGIAGAEQNRRWGMPLAGAALGFTFYAYSGAQPFVLLWAAAIALFYFREVRSQPAAFALGVALLLVGAGPRLYFMLSGQAGARLDAVAVWTAEDATAMGAAWQIAKNYVAHFDPRFLFLSGDALARHSIPGFGQLLILDVILMPVGFVVMHRRGLPLARALTLAFFLGPVGAAITRIGIPHALRSIPMLLPAAIWGGVGLAALAGWIREAVRARFRDRAKESLDKDASVPDGAQTLAIFFIFVCLAFGGRVFSIYWDTYQNDPEALAAFSTQERIAFEQAFDERDPEARVWIDGTIIYAPYFAMFYGQLPPEKTVLEGLEKQGVWIYAPTSPEPTALPRGFSPGDRAIRRDARTGEVTLSPTRAGN